MDVSFRQLKGFTRPSAHSSIRSPRLEPIYSRVLILKVRRVSLRISLLLGRATSRELLPGLKEVTSIREKGMFRSRPLFVGISYLIYK